MSNGKRKKEDFSLHALRAGDRAEYARLVEAYSGVTYRLAMKMLQNPQDAEDILQETFIKAYQHLPDFQGRSSLSTWLYRIATNEALMFLRRQKLTTVSIDESFDAADQDREPLPLVDWSYLPESELVSAETRSHMDQAVQALPPNLRVVFVLRDIEGLSTRETGEVLQLSDSAVKTRLSRARMRLRKSISSYFGERMDQQRSVDKEGT